MSKDFNETIYTGYSILLNGIYNANGLKTDAQKQNYLMQLRGPAKELWESYRSMNRHVSVDYSNRQCPEVYLLRYFFPHALLLPWVVEGLRLSNRGLNIPNNRDFHIALFGAGPCPELYGLLCYLENTQTNISNVSASLFDIEYEVRSNLSLANYSEIRKFQPIDTSWDYGRDIVFNFLLQPFCETNAYVGVEVEDRTFVIPNLTTERKPSLSEISTVPFDLKVEKQNFLSSDANLLLKNPDLIVIQNSLNEIDPYYHSQLEMNMLNIVKEMKSGAMMAIIERSSKEGYGNTYKSTNGLLRKVKSELVENFKNNIQVINNQVEQDWPDKPFEIPVGYLNDKYLPLELNNFLFVNENGLRLAKKINFHCLVVFKK